VRFSLREYHAELQKIDEAFIPRHNESSELHRAREK
jgi:hypothetical protein